MKTLDHPNIIKLFEIFDHKDFYYVVLEYCDGGELFMAIKKNLRFSEQDAANIMRQLLSAVNYMHKKSIAHRDLKPENIVFVAATEEQGSAIGASKIGIKSNSGGRIKIIDFGTAEVLKNKPLTAKVGSPYYVAP